MPVPSILILNGPVIIFLPSISQSSNLAFNALIFCESVLKSKEMVISKQNPRLLMYPSKTGTISSTASTMTLKYLYEDLDHTLEASNLAAVMYDAAGVRRAVGKQARVLNDILNNQNLTSAEKLQEMTGHTPIQVAAGAIIGLIVGLAC